MQQLTGVSPRLCCAAQLPWLQDECSQDTAIETTGSFYQLPVITSSAWPCLCLQELQEVLMWTSFVFASRNNTQSCSLVTKSCYSLNDQNVTIFTPGRLSSTLHVDQWPIQCYTTQGSHCLNGCKIVCIILSSQYQL